jgi:hypothetical protein
MVDTHSEDQKRFSDGAIWDLVLTYGTGTTSFQYHEWTCEYESWYLYIVFLSLSVAVLSFSRFLLVYSVIVTIVVTNANIAWSYPSTALHNYFQSNLLGRGVRSKHWRKRPTRCGRCSRIHTLNRRRWEWPMLKSWARACALVVRVHKPRSCRLFSYFLHSHIHFSKVCGTKTKRVSSHGVSLCVPPICHESRGMRARCALLYPKRLSILVHGVREQCRTQKAFS